MVHACYQNVTSANRPVKLLDTAKASVCPSGWKPVQWSQRGVQGLQGATGPVGATGPAGSAVVYRARSSPVTATPNGSPIFAGDSWTQSANEIDRLVGGSITFTVPATCSGVPIHSGDQVGEAVVYIDGKNPEVMYLNVPLGATAGQTVTVQPSWTPQPATGSVLDSFHYLWEPGSAKAHNFTSSSVGDSCNPETLTVENVSFDIIGIH